MVRSVCINRPVTQRLDWSVVKVLGQRINYAVGNSKARMCLRLTLSFTMQCAAMDDVRFATFTAMERTHHNEKETNRPQNQREIKMANWEKIPHYR